MTELIVGLSGHIDHGKTSIIKSLTNEFSGTLKEDESRGMTVDLGIAFLNDKITLIDEVLTPDSSRFWDIEDYQPGKSQDSYDKQIVRDWLETTDWDKEPPSPDLPIEIMNKTYKRNKSALEKLTS